MRGGPLVAVLFNVIALSALFIGNIGLKILPCNNTYKSLSDAPSLEEGVPVDDDDVVLKRTAGISTIKSRSVDVNNDGGDELVPSYLHWKLPSPEPENWQVNVNTQSVNCKNTTKQYTDPNQKIIIHFHMQHNAGTEFYAFAKGYTPCATRACWQEAKQCIVSYNEGKFISCLLGSCYCNLMISSHYNSNDYYCMSTHLDHDRGRGREY